jgi:hypothetical protein
MLTKEKHNQAFQLVSQMLEKAEKEDEAHKAWAIQNHKASQALGDGWWVHHLRALKQLLSE